MSILVGLKKLRVVFNHAPPAKILFKFQNILKKEREENSTGTFSVIFYIGFGFPDGFGKLTE